MQDPTNPSDGSLGNAEQLVGDALAHLSYERNVTMDPTAIERCQEEVAGMVVDILLETELPAPEAIQVAEVTSLLNKNVSPKLNALIQTGLTEGEIIPDTLIRDIPFDLALKEEILRKAPWVNIIHAWNAVMNQLTAVSAIQKGKIGLDSVVLASVIQKLSSLTTEVHGETLLRSSDDFIEGRTFTETKKRIAGVQGENPLRHICHAELMYILGVIREKYDKSRRVSVAY